MSTTRDTSILPGPFGPGLFEVELTNTQNFRTTLATSQARESSHRSHRHSIVYESKCRSTDPRRLLIINGTSGQTYRGSNSQKTSSLHDFAVEMILTVFFSYTIRHHHVLQALGCKHRIADIKITTDDK